MTEQKTCETCNRKLVDGEDKCTSCNKAINQVIEQKKESKLAFPKKYIIFGAVAIVIVVVAIISLIMSQDKAVAKQIAYIKDGELHLLNTKTEQKLELATNLNFKKDYYVGVNIQKSENNQFVFYPNSEDEYGTYTYYWTDTKNQGKDANSSIKVDSEVHWTNFLTKDGSKFFYKKGDENRLYVYDRKTGEKNKLDDEVESFYVNDEGNYMVYVAYHDDERVLYEMKIDGLQGTKVKIDVESHIYYADMDVKTIFYEKNEALYLKEANKEKVKLVSEFNYLPVVYNKNSFYYVKSEKTTSSLKEFLIDDLGEINGEVTEPTYPEYPNPPSMPDESDYQTEVWVDSIYGHELHPETNEWGYWESVMDVELYNADYSKYEAEYEKWDSEYSKIEDEYIAAYVNYENQVEIGLLREELEKGDNAITYDTYSLYYVNNGVESLVASNIDYSVEYASEDLPFVMYNKRVKSETNLKLSKLIDALGWYEIYDFIDEIEDNVDELFETSNEMYVTNGIEEQVLDIISDDIYSYRIDKQGNIYILTDYDEDKENGTLMKVTVKNGVVAAPVKIDEDVSLLPYGLENSSMYYFKNLKNGSGDLYLDGKLIAEDVYATSLYIYKDASQLLYYKEYSNNRYLGTLTLNKAGKETKISDDAAMYVPIDEGTIVYLYEYNSEKNRGDLMLYTEKSKSILIDHDVTSLQETSY